MRSLLIPLVLIATVGAPGATPASADDPPKEEKTMEVRGTFDVEMLHQEPDGDQAGPFGRLLLDKKYHGPLEATSCGQMLGYRSPVEGSAGYVAMELVTGSLDGRAGSFVLQHSAVMDRGAGEPLTTVVVPDSGTGALTGLAGELEIIFEGEQHVYEMRYTLPD